MLRHCLFTLEVDYARDHETFFCLRAGMQRRVSSLHTMLFFFVNPGSNSKRISDFRVVKMTKKSRVALLMTQEHLRRRKAAPSEEDNEITDSLEE